MRVTRWSVSRCAPVSPASIVNRCLAVTWAMMASLSPIVLPASMI
jgi:hypothetical protein